MDDAVLAGGTQASPQVARALDEEQIRFLARLVEWLDERRTGVLAIPVWRRDDHLRAQPLWLVVARRGQGQEPWDSAHYRTSHHGRAGVAHRLRLCTPLADCTLLALRQERARASKSELALESPASGEFWSWERRQKFLRLATLAYAFLLSLLRDEQTTIRQWLPRYGCHRTEKRSRTAAAPLYRLRSALSRLWLAYRSRPALAIPQNSG